MITHKNLLAQNAQPIGGTLKGPGGYASATTGEGASSNFASFASNIFAFLTVIAGVMFIVYFLLGSINWITAGGDKSKVEKAQGQMSNAAIGLIIVALAYSIAFIVGGVVGIEILNPSKVINTLRP